MAKRLTLVLFAMTFALPATALAAPIVFSAGGDTTTASIQATVDAFRAALGAPNNGNAPGLPSGRREINWDGGGVTTTAIAASIFSGFENTRGAEFVTPGVGFAQAPPSGGVDGGLAALFANATYGATFFTFSPQRLFVPIGSNVTDVSFSIPGTNGGTPAVISGFGAVFTDVDIAGATTLQFFDPLNASLGTFSVPTALVSSGGLSFLGVLFNAGEAVARVRITTGNAALGPNDGPATDVVAMDDFLYSEPAAVPPPVPEPATIALGGLAGVAAAARRVRRRA